MLASIHVGGPSGIRTLDTRIKSPVLFRTELTAPYTARFKSGAWIRLATAQPPASSLRTEGHDRNWPQYSIICDKEGKLCPPPPPRLWPERRRLCWAGFRHGHERCIRGLLTRFPQLTARWGSNCRTMHGAGASALDRRTKRLVLHSCCREELAGPQHPCTDRQL